MKIKYFDALAGAGKTYALAHYADRLARAGDKVLFVQPSKLLIDKTVSTEITPLEPRYGVNAIHGGTSPNVVRSIVEHFVAAEAGQGEVLFITHEAFMRLPFIQNRKQWTLIFDEVPSADLFEALTMPETHGLLTDLLELQAHDAAYARITWRQGSKTQLAKIARNARGDQVWGQFSGLASRIVSPHWAVFGLQSNYHSILKDDGHARQLMTYSLLQPSIFEGFREVLIAAALFEDSCVYQLWMMQGVEFEPVQGAMRDRLRYQQHGNGQLVTINYVTEADWSKTLRDRPDSLGQGRLRDRLPAIIREALGANPFAWMGNKDIGDDYFAEPSVRLPNSPHGLNGFQHIHNVVVLSALNAPPAHFSFMEARGIDAEALRRAHYRTAVYQAVMRISIRNPMDMSLKSITVMDRSTADWLAVLFPGSSVAALGGGAVSVISGKPGRPRRHMSAGDRVKAYRERQRSLAASIATVNKDKAALTYGTAFASIYDAESSVRLDADDDDTFIQLLRELQRRTITSKHENFLFSPAQFDPSKPGVATSRGKDNVRHARGLWLDNDGGDLSHVEFARLFPSLRMVVWNTYSSTKEHPRWRCFIPMTSAVVGDMYRRLVAQIERGLRQAGYVSALDVTKDASHRFGDHGFDVSKFGAASLFYAPCQAGFSGGSFFVDYNDAVRGPLDPLLWLANEVSSGELEDIDHPEPCAAPEEVVRPVSQPTVIEATQRWRQIAKGSGHTGFFRLAMELQRAGLGTVQIRSQLVAEAQLAHSPRERLAEVSGIMKSLQS